MQPQNTLKRQVLDFKKRMTEAQMKLKLWETIRSSIGGDIDDTHDDDVVMCERRPAQSPEYHGIEGWFEG